ncbi:hypothetical protein BGZ58_002293 [Dissophora ornata]|nr:hypothetical protein BGZ58_002293 [Dissophora ornata]
MDSSQAQDNSAPPIHLASLTSAESQQHIKQVVGNTNKISPYDPNEKVIDLNDDRHTVSPLQQPPTPPRQPGSPLQIHIQQQQQQQPLHVRDEGDLEKKAPQLPSATQTPARRSRFASVVDRVRAAQQQDHSSTMSPEHHRLHASPTYTSKPVRHASLQDQIRAERPRDPRRPSSIIQSVIENPEPHYYHHHHDDGASGSRRHHAAVMFPKIFTKEGVRNALFLNSAATAFTKSTRSKDLCNVNIPVASLAITGSAVPALWLRRDDKGRRPIAVSDSELEMGVSKQLVFRVELQYGDVKWVIRRTLYDFYRLHLILTTKRFVNLPKFPNQLSYAFSMAKATLGMRSEEKANYLRQTNLTRRHALQTYLLQVMMQLNWTIAYDLYEFLEISAMSLTKDMGWKGKEAYVETKITDSTISNICSANGFSRWEKNWALLRDSYMAFCPTVGSDEPTDVFIFDQTFFVQHKEQTLGLNMHHIELGNSHRKIEIKGEHNREMLEWMDHFTKMKQSSPWVHSHRFGSFAPEREEAKVRYYVDGKDYFHAVSDAILAAKTEIYICDWWLSPELYLRRPSELNEDFRIDRLLKRKAMEGVMIYIVVYKEIALALTLDSAHTKIWLQDLHPNIQVQRHPDHLTVNATQFWAHHEKICVIDCRLAFIGGLDLCFGRYDSRTHQLSDYHPSGNGTIWPGLDYSNPRIKDFVNVKDYNSDLIEKKLLARMPWHDVSVGVAGQPARDIARHFVQRWNFVKREKGMKKSKAHMKFLTPKGEFSSTRNESGWTGTQKVQILRSSTLWSQGVDMERSIQDAYLSSIEKAEHFIYVENQFFVTLAVENGNPDIKNKIGIALVNRILRAYQEGKKFRVIVVMPLMPAFEADIMSSEAGTLRKVMHFQYQSICRGGNSVVERLIAFGVDPSRYIGFFGLRSFDRIKHGKFDAIVEAIRDAEQQQQQKKGSNGEAKMTENEKNQQNVNTTATSNNKDDSNQNTKPTASKGVKTRSLSSKYLLEPIPKGAEAERIKAIYEERKTLDVLKTWDESITKRAMNPAMKQLGYVPAATENSLADEQLNQEIQLETTNAEIEASNSSYRQSGRTSPELMDGLGTVVRTAIDKVKGTKEEGNLEPMRHRVHRNSRIQRLRSLRHRDAGTGEGNPPMAEEVQENSGYGYETVEEEERRSIRETESINEPGPWESDSPGSGSGGNNVGVGVVAADGGDKTTSDSNATANPVELPRADEPGPIKVEKPIVDNELDDFVTEQLYIHSKLMIVDDRIIICGSANINDRSQLGFRDSEIAIIIEDTDMISTRMNGMPYQAGKLAHSLRSDLFKEHLGLLPHVEHDVVTKASVLPVDLDTPNKDPEQARQDLIRQAQQQCELEQGQQQTQPEGPQVDTAQSLPQAGATADEIQPVQSHHTSITESFGQSQHRHHRYNEGTGHLEVYTPNVDEVRSVNQWRPPTATGEAKRAAADDPRAADEIVADPLHDDFYENWWRRVAATNTEIFREVFRCVPDDTVETWDDYRNFVPNPKKVLTGHVAMEGATVDNVTERLKKVSGHLVEFPMNFLNKENLLGGAVEGAVVPMEIFT